MKINPLLTLWQIFLSVKVIKIVNLTFKFTWNLGKNFEMIARTRQYTSDLCCACMSIHVIVIPPPTPQKKIIYEGNCQVLIHMQIGMAILKYKNCVLTVFLLMMSIIKPPMISTGMQDLKGPWVGKGVYFWFYVRRTPGQWVVRYQWFSSVLSSRQRKWLYHSQNLLVLFYMYRVCC